MNNLRVGNGFDAHKFSSERDLILGGKKIDYKYGLLGHSDADVLAHAIIDSLLGAAAMPDIGRLFPDTDSKYKDISSMTLLGKVFEKLSAQGIRIINIDSVIVCQEPKISPHIDEMKKNISTAIRLEPSRISIKGKTTEGLGFTGRQEGIAAYAVCLLEVQ